MYSYLSNATQQIKINENVSDGKDIEFGETHCSALGPLVFNIDMTDLFYECEDSDVASYADGTIPCSCATYIPNM